MMKNYNVAIMGCGNIFNRHIAAIKTNAEHYMLVGLYDINQQLSHKYSSECGVKSYVSEDELYTDSEINCVVILTPNHLHYTHALNAIQHGKNVILEKPATFFVHQLIDLERAAMAHNVNIYGVLQVRLNPAVIIAKRFLAENFLGTIRGVSLVQRWQRPLNYFTGWRGTMDTGGGILREFGIHYLDTMQYLVGLPKVSYANFFNNKFKNTDVHDTIYANFDFETFGGAMEISVAAEPRNLECTLSIMGEYGFIKLGGKSLDEIAVCEFINDTVQHEFSRISDEVNSVVTATPVVTGASPHHPELYRQIVIDPDSFHLRQMTNVIQLVEDIYQFSE